MKIKKTNEQTLSSLAINIGIIEDMKIKIKKNIFRA
jgi:hypothetical protein